MRDPDVERHRINAIAMVVCLAIVATSTVIGIRFANPPHEMPAEWVPCTEHVLTPHSIVGGDECWHPSHQIREIEGELVCTCWHEEVIESNDGNVRVEPFGPGLPGPDLDDLAGLVQ